VVLLQRKARALSLGGESLSLGGESTLQRKARALSLGSESLGGFTNKFSKATVRKCHPNRSGDLLIKTLLNDHQDNFNISAVTRTEIN
jgi:hypothetical protein